MTTVIAWAGKVGWRAAGSPKVVELGSGEALAWRRGLSWGAVPSAPTLACPSSGQRLCLMPHCVFTWLRTGLSTASEDDLVTELHGEAPWGEPPHPRSFPNRRPETAVGNVPKTPRN